MSLFCLVASITPGPNNLLLMRSGARFGIRRSTSHLLGILAGCLGLLVLSWLGIGTALLTMPGAASVLHWTCFAYLLWLAVMILLDARAPSAQGAHPSPLRPAAGRPMRWYEAGAFQLINPKAWMMAITMATAFHGSAVPDAADLAVTAATWTLIGMPCMFIWTVWGASIDRVLRRPLARQAYAWTMSAAVGLTAVWMLP